MSAKSESYPGRKRVIAHPLAGTSFIYRPLETHPFLVDPHDDYRCALCHRPRALHATEDDFVAEVLPEPPREGHHKSHRGPNKHEIET